MVIIIILVMLNLIGLFGAINKPNKETYTKGTFYKFIGPVGFLLGNLITKEGIEGKVSIILGSICNILIAITLALV